MPIEPLPWPLVRFACRADVRHALINMCGSAGACSNDAQAPHLDERPPGDVALFVVSERDTLDAKVPVENLIVGVALGGTGSRCLVFIGRASHASE
jgi:hypothetical protein